MATTTPGNQTIGNVTGTHGAQIVAGTVHGNVTFGGVQPDAKRQAIAGCLDALFVINPASDREGLLSAKGQRAAGTCEWLLETDKYRSWLDGDAESSLFWINGSPGKGKTVMAIYLTQQLERENPTAAVLHFFCTNGDAKRNNANAVVRTLLWQLCTLRSDLAERLAPAFRSRGRESDTLQSNETLWALLVPLLEGSGEKPIYIVLDGLDECDEVSRDWLSSKLLDLSTSPQRSKPKVAIVSRDLRPLHRIPTSAQLRLDSDADASISSDVRRFISLRLDSFDAPDGFTGEFRAGVEAELLSRCEGTYLWVGFAMMELSRKSTCMELEETLRTLPPGLFRLYGRMLERIDPSHERVCRGILRWVTLAVRPLRLEELGDALEMRGTERLSGEERLRDHLALCAPLVKVMGDGRVGLVHQSARDYLLRDDGEGGVGRWSIRSEEGHLELARMCLVRVEEYMNDDPGPAYPMKPVITPNLRDYAHWHWPDHVRCAGELAEALMSEKMFSRNSELRYLWRRRMFYDGIHSSQDIGGPPLQMASFLGILPWMRLSLTLKHRSLLRAFRSPVNVLDFNENDSMHYATEAGHVEAVRLLLKEGAHANNRERGHFSPLCNAIRSGSVATARLLLEHGADDVGAPPYAAERGHEPLVRFFLKRGEDPNSFLQSAAGNGHESLVRLLLDPPWSADVNTYSSKGHVTHLLRKSERMNGAHSWNETEGNIVPIPGLPQGLFLVPALTQALRAGFDSVAKLLLARGADPNRLDSDGCAALHHVAERSAEGGEEIIAPLVEHGADPNAKTRRGEAPLHRAAAWRRERQIRALLEAGARADEVDREGKTTFLRIADRLHAETDGGNIRKIFDALVEHGADANARCEGGFNAVHLVVKGWKWNPGAANSGIRLLREYGVDDGAEDERGRTPVGLVVEEWKYGLEKAEKIVHGVYE